MNVDMVEDFKPKWKTLPEFTNLEARTDAGNPMGHKTKKGKTCLHLAASMPKAEKDTALLLCKKFIAFEADILATDESGMDALALAEQQFSSVLCKYLRDLEKIIRIWL